MNPWVKAALSAPLVLAAAAVLLLAFTYLMVRAPLVLAVILLASVVAAVRYIVFGD